MKLLKGVIAEDLFLYLPGYKAFILSDVHVGYEESLNRQGILIPRNNFNDLLLRLEKSLENIKKSNLIEKIVINGDIIHEFGKISKKEKDITNKLIGFLSNYAEVMLIEGNHDKVLRYILKKNVDIVEKVVFGRVLIIHGDKLISKKSLKNFETIIIGHEHPAVSITSGSRVEKYKCFLKGKYERRNLIVMPSCNLFIEGTDVLREKLLSPFLKNVNISSFEVYIVEDKIYDFGGVKNLMKQ
jgi:putative SbcD/Mre11-related phosphoesterase